MDVTKEEVQQVAKKYLKDESSVVLYYLPKQQTADNQ
jgi:predicted Zn-dependent peptidase